MDYRANSAVFAALNVGPWYVLHKNGPTIFQREFLISFLEQNGNDYGVFGLNRIKIKNILIYMKHHYLYVVYHADDECTMIHRDHYPAVSIISPNGDLVESSFYNHGVLHRSDGPAVVGHNGTELKYAFYYTNGYRHNETGPAEIYYDHNGNEEKRIGWLHGNQTYVSIKPAA